MPYDVLIIGGGIVGLATALVLKETKPELKVCLLEKEHVLANHQTGNNSGVIHSGIYYKPGSLKATNCINGYKMLLDFCNREGIPYELCGKLIVATHEAELMRLEDLYQRGLQNGLLEIKKVAATDIKHYEPYATGIGGIWIPYTGIVNYRTVAEKYAEVFTNRYSGEIFLNEKVIKIELKGNISNVVTSNSTFNARVIVNTAGLYSDKIALMTHKDIDVRIIPFRGEYFNVKKDKRHLVKNLIYPVPDPSFPFLGVHFTKRISGEIEAGPNAVFAFKKEGYKKTDINLTELLTSLNWRGFQKIMLKYWRTGMGEYYRSYNKTAFTKALQRLVPSIIKEDLIPGGAGVRAQACSNKGVLIDDFLILEDTNIIHVLNTPSPAATASLSIGKTISDKILSQF
jgi:(S)-2-hydroxyglutarate dehydrogenase